MRRFYTPSWIKGDKKMNTNNSKLQQVERGGNGISLVAGLFIGSLIGAGAALLFAPQSGMKTRAELQKGAVALRDRTTKTVNDTVTQVKSRANQIKADVQIRAGELQHRGQDILAKQLDRIAVAAERGKEAIQNS
jgi:gas vesicle protein